MENQNKKIIKPQTLKGFRDFLPEELRVRKKVIEIFSQVFEKYGYEPLETPALEYQETLLGKYGEEAEKLMYLFKDPGDREIGLKYDLTVPFCRVVAQYPNLPKPFKRYQIQSVWRADKPQKGRYREITQCDIDTVGTSSPLADAEIVALIQECLFNIRFKKFTIRINSRQVLFNIMESAGIRPEKYLTIIQTIDKLDKKSKDEVISELGQKGLNSQTINNIFTNLDQAKPDKNLADILGFIEKFQVPKDYYRFDPTLSRGLDYYTGSIFETLITEPKIGSISGGGRYDNLIGQFIGTSLPAVGTTIGLDRAVDVIREINLWPDLPKTAVTVLITIFSPEFVNNSLELDGFLYEKKIKTEIYLDLNTKLDKQLKYADQKGIPFVVILGPDEVKNSLVTVKNMQTKEQKTINKEELIRYIQ